MSPIGDINDHSIIYNFLHKKTTKTIMTTPSSTSSTSPLPSFNTVSKCAEYLKNREIGDSCILTGGTYNQEKIGEAYMHRGVRISHTGHHGNQKITLVEKTNKTIKRLSNYRATSPTRTVSFESIRTGGIQPKDKVFVQGSHATLVREIRKHIGAGNYKLEKHEHPEYGKGWILTYLTPAEARARALAREKSAKEKKDKALRYASICSIFGEKGIKIGQSFTINEEACYIKTCIANMFKKAFKDQKFEFHPPIENQKKKVNYIITRVM